LLTNQSGNPRIVYELSTNWVTRREHHFGVFAIGHLLRLINQTPVMLGSHQVSMGVSWLALIIAAVLCIWLWRLASRPGA
jgi:hypothetical protein